MQSVFEQAEEFNKKVLGIEKRPPGPASSDEVELSLIQMREEIDEFVLAWIDKDVGEMADAMVDLIYFACGVAYKQGINFRSMEKLYEAVHNANMLKAAGKKAAREYDGDAVDAFKPADWVAPDANYIIKRYDFNMVSLDVQKNIGLLMQGDHLKCVSQYPDGRCVLLTDYNVFAEEDILIWGPSDSAGKYSITDSEYFNLSEHDINGFVKR